MSFLLLIVRKGCVRRPHCLEHSSCFVRVRWESQRERVRGQDLWTGFRSSNPRGSFAWWSQNMFKPEGTLRINSTPHNLGSGCQRGHRRDPAPAALWFCLDSLGTWLWKTEVCFLSLVSCFGTWKDQRWRHPWIATSSISSQNYRVSQEETRALVWAPRIWECTILPLASWLGRSFNVVQSQTSSGVMTVTFWNTPDWKLLQ